MLLHDYRCTNCNHVQEEDHPFYLKPDIKCSKCGHPSVKMIGGAGFLLKGEGWTEGSRVRGRRK